MFILTTKTFESSTTKTHDFFLETCASNYSVIIICSEPNVDDKIIDGELFGCAYIIFRKDHDLVAAGFRSGGGVLIGVKSAFKCQEFLISYPVSTCDMVYICVKIFVNFHVTFLHYLLLRYLFFKIITKYNRR